MSKLSDPTIMRSSLDAFCSRFAVRSADLICPQSKRHASHRDAATVFKEKLSFRTIRIRKE
jgi:hypothetical protein